MDASKFVSAMRGGTRVMALTFVKGPEGINALNRLKMAYTGRGREIAIHKDDEINAIAVTASRDWGCDQNRTVRFIDLSILQDDVLAHFARDIESVTPSR